MFSKLKNRFLTQHSKLMKRIFNLLGVITLLSFALAACGGQTSRTNTGEDLVDLREEMQEVIQSIDEAIATNDISEFKNKTDDAVSSLDNKIDDYLNEMDRAERRIDQNARNRVIQMKQKKVEVEFKLALLEQDDENWYDNSDSTQNNRTRTTGNVSGTAIDRSADANLTTRGFTNDTTSTGNRTAIVPDIDRRSNNNNTRREIIYGPQMVDDLKDDLRDLRTEVEQFMQASLDDEY